MSIESKNNQIKKTKTVTKKQFSQERRKKPESSKSKNTKDKFPLPRQKWSFNDYDKLISTIAILIAIIFPFIFIIGMLSSITETIR